MPILSICITAYNIEKYIGECIESVLRQQVDFDYEIIIGEDGSTDNTFKICEAYQHKYPNIHICKREKNIGIMPNTIDALQQCRGKYVALIDGDDIWTDPLKLQKQINFLENNPDCFITFHDAQISDQSLNYKSLFSQRYPNRNYINPFTEEQVVKWQVIGATSSYVFRNVTKYPEWGKALPAGPEAYLFILALQKGKIKYFDDVMSVYRIRPDGNEKSFNKERLAERNIREYIVYRKYFYPRLKFFFFKKMLWNHSYLIFKKLKNKRLKSAATQFGKFLHDLLGL